ncbi:hypothetical protein ISN44_As05g029150 [Arabidopsis suecica]|uniref:Uncharacterized protein n=1 Tax=Arabidopsis suecica TaxID=45249 RepID=A0A8T2DTZ1_ARASU|nr:hypothetical protein ISN44_As05g029150 [Arabidopsis suecica]
MALILPYRLREPGALLKLFSGAEAVECNGACLVVITSSSLPLSCGQVMLSSCSLDYIQMSLVGRSLALIGMTSLMSIPPLNLVDFSFMEYVFPVADLENEYG